MDAFGHHVPRHRARGIEIFARKAFADDVAISHHTDQPIIFPDRTSADIVSLHQFRDFGDGSIGADPIDSLVHYVLDSHGGPPLQHSAPCRSTIQRISSDRTSALPGTGSRRIRAQLTDLRDLEETRAHSSRTSGDESPAAQPVCLNEPAIFVPI